MLVRASAVIVEDGFEDWKGEWRPANPDALRLVRELVDEQPPNAAAYEIANAAPRGCSTCVVPARRMTGIAVQIYSLWSEESQGIGDLVDVADLARQSGADVLLLSPLHAPNDGLPQQASPYFPSSRQRRNPLLARVPGVSLPNDPTELIDRDSVWRAKHELATDALVDEQLRAAANAGAGLIHDIAVGFDPDGYDADLWTDLIAPGMHIGAPPDALGPDGQDWGVPPFVPHLLSMVDYAPLRAAFDSAAEFGAGIRIDHVMGLFRLFWIPDGADPADGVYVRYPVRELLDVVAEISRARDVFVVGEDLGTVEPGVRDVLARRNVLSYKVLMFEDDPPPTWPPLSLAAATTHDLPTLAGRGLDPEAVHATLREAGSDIVVFTAEDLVRSLHQPNEPGTVKPTNWSRRLPVDVDAVAQAFRRTAARGSEG